MKEYLKPDLEYVKFVTENIADIGSGSGSHVSNEFEEDDFS